MTRSSRRKEALTCFRFPTFRFPLFSLSLLTSAATRGGKLLLVRTGNIRTRKLKARFERRLPETMAALEQNSLVELDRQTVRVVV